MNRWLRMLWLAAVVVLLAALGLVSARTVQLSSELRDVRGTVQALKSQLDDRRAALDQAQRAFERAEKRLKVEQREFRQRQGCGARGGHGPQPHLTAVPDDGPVGARVTVVGDCFLEPFWKDISGYSISLLGELDSNGQVVRSGEVLSCELIAFGDDVDWKVSNGRAIGHFTVPARGDCFQEDRQFPVVPGVYRIIVGCHACTLTTFTVSRG